MNNIKKILENNKISNKSIPKNHRDRFEKKLLKELHPIKRKYSFLKFAASLLLLVSVSLFIYQKTNTTKEVVPNYTLGSLSPELEKIENYYINAISYELAKIDLNEDNKQILDKYFEKLEQLTKQYEKESAQINIDKISEKTINALIDNLQLRLQLLLQLKEQLKIIKIKKNENKTI